MLGYVVKLLSDLLSSSRQSRKVKLGAEIGLFGSEMTGFDSF